jgi:hypothetical protein
MYHGADTGLFGLLELPFLFIAVFFAFRVAAKLEGGAFGAGMFFLAWGFLVMAVGHLVMQVQRFANVNLLAAIFGPTLGDVVWVVVLAITWSLSAYGFLRIYRAAAGSR